MYAKYDWATLKNYSKKKRPNDDEMMSLSIKLKQLSYTDQNFVFVLQITCWCTFTNDSIILS